MLKSIFLDHLFIQKIPERLKSWHLIDMDFEKKLCKRFKVIRVLEL